METALATQNHEQYSVGTVELSEVALLDKSRAEISAPLLDSITSKPISVQIVNKVATGEGISSSFSVPVATRADPYRALIRRFEGRVTEIREAEDEYFAILTDKAGLYEDHIASFQLSDIREEDRELVNVNSSFYYTLYHTTLPGGTITYDDSIKFRRIAKPTSHQKMRIEKTAQAIFDAFPQMKEINSK